MRNRNRKQAMKRTDIDAKLRRRAKARQRSFCATPEPAFKILAKKRKATLARVIRQRARKVREQTAYLNPTTVDPVL